MTHSPRKPHVLVVGIDGVRYDCLLAATTPALDRIAASGRLLPVRIHEKNRTISGPVWSTVATGVYADRHRITGNSTRTPELDTFPDFMERLRKARPELQTFAAATWPTLVTDNGCGPIFSSRGWVPSPSVEERGDDENYIRSDDAVAAHAAVRLATEDIAACFLHLNEADHQGHEVGVGELYREAIERCDARLGVIRAAIDSRPARSEEDWTVIVVTDHGHLDAGGHGGETEQERSAWIAVTGDNLDTEIEALDHADISTQVLATFGITNDDADGLPFGARVVLHASAL
ncbi:alkaline phosphatase family protein [Arthrobacter tecti]